MNENEQEGRRPVAAPQMFGKPTQEEQNRGIYLRVYMSLIPVITESCYCHRNILEGTGPLADYIAATSEMLAVAACKRLGITVDFKREDEP